MSGRPEQLSAFCPCIKLTQLTDTALWERDYDQRISQPSQLSLRGGFPTGRRRLSLRLLHARGKRRVGHYQGVYISSRSEGDGWCPSVRHLPHLVDFTNTDERLTIHNVHYLLSLMGSARDAILEDRFPAFLRRFFANLYGEKTNYPHWAVRALRRVGVDLLVD